MTDPNTPQPSTPAGWYPNAEGLQQYWDGSNWTDNYVHSSGAVVPRSQLNSAIQPTPPELQPVKPKMPRWRLILVLAIVGVILLIGIISGAVSAANKPSAQSAVEASSPLVSTVPSPTSASTPSTPPPDATYFKGNAGKNLDDYSKDLNDLRTALNDSSTVRLLSNDLELSFNLGQLQALTPTSNIAAQWNAALTTLATQTEKMTTDISNSTYDPLGADIDATAATVESLKAIANQAVTG